MSHIMDSNMVHLMEFTLAYAQGKADQAEVMVDRSDKFTLSAHEGKIDQYQLSHARAMGVRVIKGNQVGISYTENVQQDDLKAMVDLALENSVFMKEDPYQKLAEIDTQASLVNVHTKNYREDDSNTQDKIAFTLSLESDVKQKNSNIKAVPYNGYQEHTQERYLFNTLGVNCYEKARQFTCYTSCFIQDGERNAIHNYGTVASTFDQLDKQRCVEQSYDIAHALLNANSLKSGKYDIIFSIDCLKSFLNCFSVIYSAKSAIDGKNPFKDKVGTQVFNSSLSVIDCPQYEHASYHHQFDDEGSLQQELTLIEQGVLRSFYHNSATSTEMGVDNTAHASRSSKSQLGVKGTTRVIRAGNNYDQSLQADAYLEIVKMQGLHSGANPISGEFSFAISGFYHIQGDKIPFKGMTLSGNFYQMMKSQVMAVGQSMMNDSYRSFFSPQIRFSKMSISGN